MQHRPRPLTSCRNTKEFSPTSNKNISTQAQVKIYRPNLKSENNFQSMTQKNTEKPLPRMLPKNIPYDKEFLYEDNWRLKQELNRMQFEINKISIEKGNVEKLLKKSNESSQMQSRQDSKFNNSLDGSLLMNFRQQLRQQQKEIEVKDAEINKLKHDQKQTRFSEMAAELEEYKEECKRLANVVKTISKQEQNESKILNDTNTNSLIQSYKNDNINLSNLVRKLEEDNNDLTQKIKQIELERDRINHKFRISQKQVQELNKQNQFLRQEMYPAAQGQKKQNQKLENENLKRLLDDRKSEIQQLQLKVGALEKANNDYDRRLKEIDQEQIILRNIEAKEKEKLNDKILSLKQENERLEKELAVFEESEDDKNSDVEETNLRSSMKLKSSINKQNQVAKKVPRVNNYDIMKIAKELKFRLMSQQINYDQLDSLILANSSDYEEQISISQLTQSLKSEPFLITSNEQAILLSRYLVEDNQDDFIVYDSNRSQEKTIAKSVFKKVIGHYELLTKDEIEKIEIVIATIFNKYKHGMMQAIKQMAHKKTMAQNYCDQEDFQNALAYCDVLLTQRQQEYLELINYQQTSSLDLIEYNKLLEKFDQIFKIQEQKKKEEEELQRIHDLKQNEQQSPKQSLGSNIEFNQKEDIKSSEKLSLNQNDQDRQQEFKQSQDDLEYQSNISKDEELNTNADIKILSKNQSGKQSQDKQSEKQQSLSPGLQSNQSKNLGETDNKQDNEQVEVKQYFEDDQVDVKQLDDFEQVNQVENEQIQQSNMDETQFHHQTNTTLLNDQN